MLRTLPFTLPDAMAYSCYGAPANFYSLAAVNFFLGCVGVVQCSRIFMYHRSQTGSSGEAAKEMEHEVADPVKKLGQEAEAAVEKK